MKARMLLTTAAIVALLVPVCLAGAACVASGKSAAGGRVDGRLAPCPSTPNCVCSEDPAEGAAIPALAFEGDPDVALASLVEHLRARPRVELVRIEADYVHAVFTSALFRFPDDVEFRLDRGASVIHVRSASRIGRSDLGANRRRVESLRAEWPAAVPR